MYREKTDPYAQTKNVFVALAYVIVGLMALTIIGPTVDQGTTKPSPEESRRYLNQELGRLGP